jgi:hypothetical protein
MTTSFTGPLFAALDGPFFLDLPNPETTGQAPSRVNDLRTGKEAGTMDAKALSKDSFGVVRLSPDGQYLVSRSLRVPGASAEVWKLGADQPTATLPIGDLRWLDFRSADEVVTVSRDERKWSVQTWGVPGWEPRRSVELPAQPDR